MIPLTEEDEVVVELGFDTPGHLAEASTDYHAFIHGEWRSVVRYDNAHGIAHVHRPWRRRRIQPLGPRTTPTALLRLAMHDLLANWHVYRTRLEAHL